MDGSDLTGLSRSFTSSFQSGGRSAQGIVRLADKHPDRLDAACARAMAAGDPSYRTVKGILTAGTETEPAAETHEVPTAGAHLHGPQALFETGEAS